VLAKDFTIKRGTIMTDYIWQLGIDWNAIQTGGVGYLRGGLGREVTDGEVTTFVPLPGTNPVQTGDHITFRIFDVTSSTPPAPSPVRSVSTIESFGIDSRAAVRDQQLDTPFDPLDETPPPIGQTNEPAAPGSLLGNAHCSWDSEPVEVKAASGRFLLTVYLQATGLDGVSRLFNHDPEMVVGPNG
jgi:hypothetical protein